MGTNYYCHNIPCAYCGRANEPIHIGKSSAGWCFALRIHPDLGIHNLPEWEEFWVGKIIKDEYGREIHPVDLLAIITARYSPTSPEIHPPFGYPNWDEFHRSNHSMRGPKNLLRCVVGGKSKCVGHGKGTWDLFESEFS